ncbi:MAG: hypothetical protein ABR507_08550 [Actinomycetota bacterium]|nr:hypothetical protein [Actinomycetota bacterium]
MTGPNRASTACLILLFLATCAPHASLPTGDTSVAPGVGSPGRAHSTQLFSTKPTTKRSLASPSPPTSLTPDQANGSVEPGFVQFFSASDQSGDHGTAAPGYADIVSLRLSDDGTSLHVTVRFAQDVPARLPQDTTMGLGIDLYSGQTRESDQQLFADGSTDGWTGYLYGVSGESTSNIPAIVSGPEITLRVEWAKIGGRKGGYVSAFCDWSHRSGIFNEAGEDHVPDSGRLGFTP